MEATQIHPALFKQRKIGAFTLTEAGTQLSVREVLRQMKAISRQKTIDSFETIQAKQQVNKSQQVFILNPTKAASWFTRMWEAGLHGYNQRKKDFIAVSKQEVDQAIEEAEIDAQVEAELRRLDPERFTREEHLPHIEDHDSGFWAGVQHFIEAIITAFHH